MGFLRDILRYFVGRAAAVLLILVPLAVPSLGGDDYLSRGTLKGIKGILVGIDPLPLDAQKLGLTDDMLKRGLEGKLRSYGIKLLEKQDPTAPVYLFADFTLNKPQGAPFFVYSVTLSLKQLVYLKRDSTIQVAAPTWSLTRNGLAGEKVFTTALHKATLELGDKFCGAYKAVNPK